MSDSCCSGPMIAWVLVLADPPKPVSQAQPEGDLPDEPTIDQIRELLARETVQ